MRCEKIKMFNRLLDKRKLFQTLFSMRDLRDEKSEMPADFANYINLWSLESITAIALERRLNALSGSSKDEKAQILIENIRVFIEKSFEFDGLPSVWKYYETRAFKDFLKVYDTITEWVVIKIIACI